MWRRKAGSRTTPIAPQWVSAQNHGGLINEKVLEKSILASPRASTATHYCLVWPEEVSSGDLRAYGERLQATRGTITTDSITDSNTFYLALAILAEVTGTVFIKFSDGYTWTRSS